MSASSGCGISPSRSSSCCGSIASSQHSRARQAEGRAVRTSPIGPRGKRRALEAGVAFDLVLGRVVDARAEKEDWSTREPGFRDLVDEIRRLLRRAKRCKFLSTLIVLALTGGLVAKEATNRRQYQA